MHPIAPTAGNTASLPQDADTLAAIYRKIMWRLLPFLFVAYVLNTIDRINISFAKLRMASDLGLSDAAYGIGAAAFFAGYILFEVPSNLYMQKIGARLTITRIMLLWGLVTIATSQVSSPEALYVARFLLGVAEAGFFPGVILYLTYWFPTQRRGRITSLFLMSGTFAGMISGPLAAAIMLHLDGWMGLRDWQALFVVEGIPAVLLALVAYRFLDDSPAQAAWLSPTEKSLLASDLGKEVHAQQHGGIKALLKDPRIYVIGLTFLSIYASTNTIAYWMPTLIQGFGEAQVTRIGWISTLPYVFGLVTMYLLARSSDRHLERRWHVAGCLLVAAASFLLMGIVRDELVPSVLCMTIGAAACLAALPVFWTIPPAYLGGTQAPAGIAFISSLGGVAALLSPIAVGAIKTRTGDLYLAFDLLAALLAVGAVVLLLALPARLLGHSRRPGDGADQG
ncbi:MFS transporter [Cupriavidus metallidurans]|uniref:MFS transporter n=1 Tax=Cupriavidus metallidurans TaxID=119219 RepID=UPI001BFBF6EF|nr:MFS transporter [Cupriavidus metallidurans]QWC90792.1 MFS transporter [Cupriavidus metallidurans]